MAAEPTQWRRSPHSGGGGGTMAERDRHRRSVLPRRERHRGAPGGAGPSQGGAETPTPGDEVPGPICAAEGCTEAATFVCHLQDLGGRHVHPNTLCVRHATSTALSEETRRVALVCEVCRGAYAIEEAVLTHSRLGNVVPVCLVRKMGRPGRTHALHFAEGEVSIYSISVFARYIQQSNHGWRNMCRTRGEGGLVPYHEQALSEPIGYKAVDLACTHLVQMALESV